MSSTTPSSSRSEVGSLEQPAPPAGGTGGLGQAPSWHVVGRL